MISYTNNLDTEDVYREIKVRLRLSGYKGHFTVEMLHLGRLLLKYNQSS